MTILDELADYARVRTAEAKKKRSPEEVKKAALALPKGDYRFETALKKPGISFICECKKASPSKGLIAPEFPYLEIAKAYECSMLEQTEHPLAVRKGQVRFTMKPYEIKTILLTRV